MTDENTQQHTPDTEAAFYLIHKRTGLSTEPEIKSRTECALSALCQIPAALEALGLCKKSERDTYKAQLLACMADCAEKIKKLEKKYAKK